MVFDTFRGIRFVGDIFKVFCQKRYFHGFSRNITKFLSFAKIPRENLTLSEQYKTTDFRTKPEVSRSVQKPPLFVKNGKNGLFDKSLGI